MKKLINCIAVLILSTALYAQSEDPQPGEVFKEFFAESFSMYQNKVTADSTEVVVHIDDLKYAVRAELSPIESHAHIGTSDRSFRVNNGEKNILSKPGTPNDGYCYHYQHYGRSAAGIPLSELTEGDNLIKFYEGIQICHGFNWPGWGAMGGLVVRVYYDPGKKEYPRGKIVSPLSNSEISEHLLIEVNVNESLHRIVSVDIIGNYYGFPFDGTGKFQNWHYRYQTGSVNWHGQIDRRTRPPYNFYWDLSWLPDQNKPIRLAARVTDERGISFITPAVEGLTLKRDRWSVKMYVCSNLPEKFQSRMSERMSCKILVPDDTGNAESAILQSVIWPGHLEGKYVSNIGLNETILQSIKNTEDKIDRHNYFPYEIPIPSGILKNGENDFFIFSDTEGHMTEVYWPGPAILIKYKKDR